LDIFFKIYQGFKVRFVGFWGLGSAALDEIASLFSADTLAMMKNCIRRRQEGADGPLSLSSASASSLRPTAKGVHFEDDAISSDDEIEGAT